MRLFPTFATCFLAFASTVWGEPSAAAKMAGYIESHCLKCHGPEKQKGDLRLDELALPPSHSQQWEEVLEAIEYGDMPPKKQPRPAKADTENFTSVIKGLLREKAAPAQPAVRRMNRVEYENTVRDLLGVDTEIAEMLPEDGKSSGFDNVAGGLSVSSVLLEKYLEAANVAFDDVIRRYPPIPAATRRSIAMEEEPNIATVKKGSGGIIESHGAFVDFTDGWPISRFDSAQPTEPGIYRCRVSVWPLDPGERTMTVGIFTGPLFTSNGKKFHGYFDVTGTPDKPTVIEFTTRMDTKDAIEVLPWVFPGHVTYRDKHEKRPGIAIQWVETHGPLDQDFPSLSQQRLFGESKTMSMQDDHPHDIFWRGRKVMIQKIESSAPEEDVKRILLDFLPRALRGPVERDTADQFIALALGRLKEGRSFEDAVRTGITAILCSPKFLLLNSEPKVDDYMIASRMSYFLWSTMPDTALLKLASQGKLKDPAIRRAQALRMLEDPKSERFVKNFTGQWLDLRDINFTTPDKNLFYKYDTLLDKSLTRETEAFFREMIARDLNVMNFIDSDFAMLNERLAAHYGIEGVKGHEKIRAVKLPGGSIRGGVLTQASVLKVTANGTNTSPVLRGVWVLDRLLARPVPPPPPGVPAVEPDIRGATSPKEMFSKHTENATCARCHARIDPVGFALEEFDPVGEHRSNYRQIILTDEKGKVTRKPGLPVDSSGETPDGVAFTNFEGFQKWLLGQPEMVTSAIAQKLLIYGCGRTVGVMDDKAVEGVVKASAKNNFGLRTMIQEVVASDFFLKP